MRWMLSTPAAAVVLALWTATAGCSLIVQPDDRRLTPQGDGAAATDGLLRADGAPTDATPLADGDAVTPPPVDVPAPPIDVPVPPRDVPVPPMDVPVPPVDVPVPPRDVPPPMDVPPPPPDVPPPPMDVPPPPPDVPPPPPDVPPPMCPAVCTDGVACTVDRCDTTTGRCVFTPDDTLCGARQRCDAVMGCVAAPCRGDADCSDGNACNGAERCVAGACVAGTALRCDDGQFCNGVETCNPATGCVAGVAPTCTSVDPCNAGRCDPTALGGAGACTFSRIAGCPLANDTCATALALPLPAAGGTVAILGSTRGAGSGVDSACGTAGAGDVWYTVTYPSNQDLRVEVGPAPGALATADTVVVLRDGCTSPDLVCNDDFSRASRASRVWLRAPTATPPSPTRTVRIIVDAYQPGAESDFVLRVTSSAAVVSNTCAAPGFDVSEGGTVRGSASAGTGATRGSCGGGGGTGTFGPTPEDLYRYAGPAGGNVQFTLRPAGGAAFFPTVYARNPDCTTGPELRCSTGNPAQIEFAQPLATPTYVFVDGLPSVTFGTVPYTLQVLRP